ncbi:MAG: 50S ribosomal protein L11 methyltransferase [Desulfarculaceae bacterium]|nr:50S ribosomal protein L11 methyltransferase [Desulfarculaceae bacterium]
MLQSDDLLYIYYLKGTIDPDDPRPLRSDHFQGTWAEDGCSFLFFTFPEDELVEKLVKNTADAQFMDRYEMTVAQWHGDSVEPFVVGGIRVIPSWEYAQPEKNGRKQVVLNPGVVFGTGRHPTTEDSLDLMQALIRHQPVRTCLDIGTGTGLLSLAAAVMGVGRAVACDFNMLAVKTARENAKINDLKQNILAVCGKGEELIDIRADLLMANIHYDVMKALVETQGFYEKKWFVLSGLFNSQAEKILSRLHDKPVTILERRCPDGMWNTISGRVEQPV